MGIFSKKDTTKTQSNNEFKPINILAPCPVCKINNHFHIRWNGLASCNYEGQYLEKEYGLKDFYGYNVGVCSDCGIVQHDTVLFASTDFDESWKIYNILTNALANYLYCFDINTNPSLTSNDKALLAYKLITDLKEQIRQEHIDFPENIDLLDFIKNCRQ